MKRQLENSSCGELRQVLNRRDEELVRHLCLDTYPDREWESLPHEVRKMFVKRVAGEPYEFLEIQRDWIESNRCNQKIPYQTYLARRDLHASVSLLIDEYSAALLRDPIQRTVAVRREIINDIAGEADRAVAPSKTGLGWRILLKPFIRIKTALATFLKFTFLALIAEPEYQRELVYVLNGNILRIPVTFLATRLWIYSRIIQNLLLPFFLVLLLHF
jgi:hypothetical protein